MDEKPVRVMLTVKGTVQGVGFRWWSKGLAETLGITGKVWNVPDGSVGIQAQGSRKAVESFIQAVSRGPSRASVSGVETRLVPWESNSNAFEIVFFREES